MLQDSLSLRARRVIALVVCVVLVIIVISAYQAILSKTHGTLVVNTIPKDTVVVVDDKTTVLVGYKISLPKGTHSITLSRDGFKTQTQQVTIVAGKTNTVPVLMEIANATGDQWLKDNPDQASLREGIGGTLGGQKNDQIQSKYPLVSSLPLADALFRIDAGVSKAHPNDPTSVAIYITAPTPTGRQAALDLIKLKGYNPGDYEIIFQ